VRVLGTHQSVGLILGTHSLSTPCNGLALGPKLSYYNISIDVLLRCVSFRCLLVLCFILK
jgi:hypothetical protein